MRLVGTLIGRRSRRPGRFAIDRFSLLDGCVVATGWSEDGMPRLFHRGRPVRNVSRQVVERPELSDVFGRSTTARGFRLAAVVGEDFPQAEDLALRIGREEIRPAAASAVLEGAPGTPPADYARMLERFIGAMSGQSARLLEIGSRARSGNSYRGLFPESVEHVGLDIATGANVDIVGDAHHLSRHVEGLFGFVYSVSVFEHLLMPWKAAIEMNHVLEVGGLAYIQSHAAWPLHEEPWDFFRFSRDAWHGLFNAHTGFEILETGQCLHASIVPRHAGDGPLLGLDAQPAFLLSGCLARKVSPPKVAWDAEVGEVYDLAYSHR